MKEILILGGYGNFGNRIAMALTKANIAVIIAGRNQKKAEEFLQKLKTDYPNCYARIAIFDAKNELSEQLRILNPIAVINTAGPFQNSDYYIAETCIQNNVHYIDLADGRDFVREIASLNQKAQDAGVLVVSGASTVPALSSAVLEKYKNQFSQIDSLLFGISPGQKAHRGLATTKGILSYIGKPLKPFAGNQKTSYGWQDIYQIKYPELGKRWMANCDIPDLDLLPNLYNIGSIRFSAGMESSLLHLGIWFLSWLIRFGLPIDLTKYANFLLKSSHWFDCFGTAEGGMHMVIKGVDHNNNLQEIRWFVVAKNGDGPQIPTIPAIILAKKIVHNKIQQRGAMPCVAMISLEEYMEELTNFAVKQYELKIPEDSKKVGEKDILYYDGNCGFCHRSVRLLLNKDKKGVFRVSPLQSKHFENSVPKNIRDSLPDSIVLLTCNNQILIKSSAIIYIFRRLGFGLILAGLLLWIIPKPIRDYGYDFIGKIRNHLFKKPEGLCPLVREELRNRFCDMNLL